MIDKHLLWNEDFSHAYSDEEFDALSRVEKAAVMRRWFEANFEDPVHRLPYISAEGGYQYIWGGPHDAAEELADRFDGLADDDLIDMVVSDVESDGITEWSPTDSPDDYDPEEGGEYSENVYLSRNSKEELLALVDRLDTLVEPLRHSSMIGHNNPPSAIEENEDFIGEVKQLSDSLHSLRVELEGETPQKSQLEDSIKVIRNFTDRVTTWISDRLKGALNSATEDFIKYGIGAVSLYVFQNHAAIIDAGRNLVQALTALL